MERAVGAAVPDIFVCFRQACVDGAALAGGVLIVGCGEFRNGRRLDGDLRKLATSGGEGVALSYERDQFHAALAREFGYDPTKNNP